MALDVIQAVVEDDLASGRAGECRVLGNFVDDRVGHAVGQVFGLEREPVGDLGAGGPRCGRKGGQPRACPPSYEPGRGRGHARARNQAAVWRTPGRRPAGCPPDWSASRLPRSVVQAPRVGSAARLLGGAALPLARGAGWSRRCRRARCCRWSRRCYRSRRFRSCGALRGVRGARSPSRATARAAACDPALSRIPRPAGSVFPRQKGDRATSAAHTARAANTVRDPLRRFRQFVVDHLSHLGHVQPARRDVGRQQDGDGARAEAGHDAAPRRVLAEVCPASAAAG